MSDANGKGIVRGQVDNTNLRAYTRDSDVPQLVRLKLVRLLISLATAVWT